MGTGFASCATWGEEQTLIYNAAYIPFLGARHPEALGKPISTVWHDVWDDISPLVDRATAGDQVFMEDMHLVMTRNGAPEDTYWTFSYSPLREDGRVQGILDIAVETTARVKAEQTRAMLVAETSHRLKNTLALVQAVAQQSLRHVTEQAAVDVFNERLQALASAHDVLHRQDWSEADLAVTVESALGRLVEGARYQIEGPQLHLSARNAQTLTLIVHELTTNAMKYGAFTEPSGVVSVSWRLDGPIVRLEWVERGGPPVVAPKGKGFGSRLISFGLTGQGDVQSEYETEGLTVRFSATVESLMTPYSVSSTETPR
jgi:two-component sensor histidine kinase